MGKVAAAGRRMRSRSQAVEGYKTAPSGFPKGAFHSESTEYQLRGCMKGPRPFISNPQQRHVRCEERLQAASDIIFRPYASRTGK